MDADQVESLLPEVFGVASWTMSRRADGGKLLDEMHRL